MGWLSTALQALAENSPYALVIVLFMYFSNSMQTKSLNVLKENFDRSIDIIQKSNDDAVTQMRETLKTLSEISK